jgi:hypothetical protein
MGYGSRALQALNAFYSGEYYNFEEAESAAPSYANIGDFDPVSRIRFVVGLSAYPFHSCRKLLICRLKHPAFERCQACLHFCSVFLNGNRRY